MALVDGKEASQVGRLQVGGLDAKVFVNVQNSSIVYYYLSLESSKVGKVLYSLTLLYHVLISSSSFVK